MWIKKRQQYNVLLFWYFLSVAPLWLSFLKWLINFDKTLCRSVTFKGVICICKFDKDQVNISGTSLYTPIANLGQAINYSQTWLNTLCVTHFFNNILRYDYSKLIFHLWFPPSSGHDSLSPTAHCHTYYQYHTTLWHYHTLYVKRNIII